MKRTITSILAGGFLLQLALFAWAFGTGHDSPLVFIVVGLVVTTAAICTAELVRRHCTAGEGS